MISATSEETTRRFHDRHHAFQYLVGFTIGGMIARDPSLIRQARTSLDRIVGTAPQHAHIRAIWGELLDREPEDIAFELMRNDERGDLIRQTRPPFVALPPELRADLLVQAHKLVAAPG